MFVSKCENTGHFFKEKNTLKKKDLARNSSHPKYMYVQGRKGFFTIQIVSVWTFRTVRYYSAFSFTVSGSDCVSEKIRRNV